MLINILGLSNETILLKLIIDSLTTMFKVEQPMNDHLSVQGKLDPKGRLYCF